MTATGYNQVLVMIDHFTKYARNRRNIQEEHAMQEEHATAQIRQKRRFDKRTADAKAYLEEDKVLYKYNLIV